MRTRIYTSTYMCREWYELERPEDNALPGDWRKMSEFHKLLIIRALRPDRMSEALALFVKSIFGVAYVTSQPFDLARSFDDVNHATPVFFILSPGVDPVRDTERLAKEHRVGFELGNFALVSLGQGQEQVAERAVDSGYKGGSWAFLQNVHLTPRWTSSWLERKVEDLDNAHPDFRLFLSAEPAMLPVNLLQVIHHHFLCLCVCLCGLCVCCVYVSYVCMFFCPLSQLQTKSRVILL
jgi:dynein heavy chain